jgi:hypothetical protein
MKLWSMCWRFSTLRLFPCAFLCASVAVFAANGARTSRDWVVDVPIDGGSCMLSTQIRSGKFETRLSFKWQYKGLQEYTFEALIIPVEGPYPEVVGFRIESPALTSPWRFPFRHEVPIVASGPELEPLILGVIRGESPTLAFENQPGVPEIVFSPSATNLLGSAAIFEACVKAHFPRPPTEQESAELDAPRHTMAGRGAPALVKVSAQEKSCRLSATYMGGRDFELSITSSPEGDVVEASLGTFGDRKIELDLEELGGPSRAVVTNSRRVRFGPDLKTGSLRQDIVNGNVRTVWAIGQRNEPFAFTDQYPAFSSSLYEACLKTLSRP